ncbi:MAG: ATP phosphoribosyltransferase [Butyricicoccus sp.]
MLKAAGYASRAGGRHAQAHLHPAGQRRGDRAEQGRGRNHHVEHGVCDMGVVGKDTIMEKGGSFYEMVDLGFGECRFALATKKGKDVYGGYKTPVIATKYPAVTKAFFNKKNMDVETIKIEGSVELAPLLELADGIVDIVETGTTLKENGLEVVEDVAPISARVIVNLASAKMKKAAIQKVIAELENGLNN